MPLGTVPSGSYLVAGLRPCCNRLSSRFSMGSRNNNGEYALTMVDIDNNKGGGLDEAFELIKNGGICITCYHWVIEENGFQKAIRQDKTIKEFCKCKV